MGCLLYNLLATFLFRTNLAVNYDVPVVFLSYYKIRIVDARPVAL